MFFGSEALTKTVVIQSLLFSFRTSQRFKESDTLKIIYVSILSQVYFTLAQTSCISPSCFKLTMKPRATHRSIEMATPIFTSKYRHQQNQINSSSNFLRNFWLMFTLSAFHLFRTFLPFVGLIDVCKCSPLHNEVTSCVRWTGHGSTSNSGQVRQVSSNFYEKNLTAESKHTHTHT